MDSSSLLLNISLNHHPLYLLFISFCLLSFLALTSSHRVELLPACEDNHAVCSELIQTGRALPVSLHHSWSQHAHFQLSCSARANQRTFGKNQSHELLQSTWVRAARGFTPALCFYIQEHVCILNALGV